MSGSDSLVLFWDIYILQLGYKYAYTTSYQLQEKKKLKKMKWGQKASG